MVIGDAILISDAERHYDGYRVGDIGYADLDPDMTRALADKWAETGN